VTTIADLRAPQRAVAVLATMALVVAAFVTGTVTAGSAGATTVESTFVGKLNHARAARGVHRLTVRSHLVTVARAQALRMASRGVLYHNPRLTSEVRNWRWVGENVGYGPDAATVHVAFMNSPGHRANLLDRDYTEVGVGVVVRNGRVWVAEVFRRPLRAITSSSSAASAARFTHPLRYGSTGPAVKRVQRRLGVRPTGFYGHVTEAAVSRFQKRQGWAGRGIVGRATWSRLF
jgi:uncharacterized protein YkwD